MDLAQLEIAIDPSSASRARRELDKLAESSGRVERATDQLARSYSSLGRQIGLTAAASATGFLALARSSINAADATGKAAQAAGLATEQYSSLSYAAKLAGVEGQAFGVALSQLNKQIASNGAALADLGISTTTASGQLKNADRVLGEVADRFASMPDGAQKATLALQLFGERGRDLVPLLNQGRAGIEQVRMEAERLGVVISTDTARASEQFNDDLTRLQTAISGVGLRLASEMLPGLTAASTYLARATADAGLFEGSLITLGAAIARTFGLDELGKLETLARNQSAEIERLTNVMVGLDNVLERDPGNQAAQRRYENLRLKLFDLQREAVATTQRMKELAEEASRPAPTVRQPTLPAPTVPTASSRATARATRSLRSETAFVGPEVPESLSAAIQRLVATDVARIASLRAELQALVSIKASGGGGVAVDEAIRDVEAAIVSLDPAQQAAIERQRALNALLADTPTAQIERAREQMELLQAALSQTADPAQAQKIREAMAALTDGARATSKITEEAKKASDFAQQLGSSFSSALEGALVDMRDLRSVGQGLVQDLQGLLKDGLRTGIRETIAKPFGQAVTDLIKSGPSALGSATGAITSAGSTAAASTQLAASAAQTSAASAAIAAITGETAARTALTAALTGEASAVAAVVAAITSETAARTGLLASITAEGAGLTASVAAMAGETAGRTALAAVIAGETAAATALTGSLSAAAAAATSAAASFQAAAAGASVGGGGGLFGSLLDIGGSLFGVPSFDVGTNRVPRDMLALVHEGEAIVPKAYNPAIGGSNAAAAPAVNVKVNIIGGPSQAPQVSTRQDSNGGLTIDVLYEQFEQRLNARTAQGYGLAPALSNRFGVNGAAGLR